MRINSSYSPFNGNYSLKSYFPTTHFSSYEVDPNNYEKYDDEHPRPHKPNEVEKQREIRENGEKNSNNHILHILLVIMGLSLISIIIIMFICYCMRRKPPVIRYTQFDNESQEIAENAEANT